jgi:hypothetical protein
VSNVLPPLNVDLRGQTPKALATRKAVLKPGELTRLLAVDTPVGPRAGGETALRVYPLAPGRIAAGRATPFEVCWRIVESTRDSQPGALWSDDMAFSADAPERPLSETLAPLKALVRDAAPLCGKRRETIKALARVIGGIRTGRKPVALVVADEARTPGAAEAFAMALLKCLPAKVRDEVRLSTWEPAPKPKDWTFVICPTNPGEAFEVVDATAPQDEGHDLVAYYVRNRLQADDPEAVEKCATWNEEGSPDPWGDAVKAHLKKGIPGVTLVDDAMIQRDAESAVRALVARLRAGADIDESLAKTIGKVTMVTGDPRPWRALVSRSAIERAKVISVWLPDATRTRPRRALLRTIAALYPRGAPLDPWYNALLKWYRDGFAIDLIQELLGAALLDDPRPMAPAVRAGCWSEICLALARRGTPDALHNAVVGPIGQSLVASGAARALVPWWFLLAPAERSADRAAALVQVLRAGADGDVAVASLIDGLSGFGQSATARSVIGRWAEHRPEAQGDDPVLARITALGLEGVWIEALAASQGPEAMLSKLRGLSKGPDDPVWATAASAWAAASGGGARDRLVALQAWLPDGIIALEPVARGLVGDAVAETRFPDEALCEIATAFASEGSSLWAFVAIASAPAERFAEETVDASVVAVTEQPPEDGIDRTTVLRCAEAIGSGRDEDTLGLARWVVRLQLSPDGDGTGFQADLAEAVVTGLATNLDRLGPVLQALLELPPDHETLRFLLDRGLPGKLGPDQAADLAGRLDVIAVDDGIIADLQRSLGLDADG